jgi:intein-encoded DNA endonuclease-like protein
MGIGLVGTTADFAPWSWVNPLYRRLLIRENSQNRDPIGEVRLADTSASAIKVAIYDGVLYIRSKSGFFTYLTTHKEQYNILSSLLLRDFLYAIGS